MPRRPRKQPRASNSIELKGAAGHARKGDSKLKRWVRREDIEGDDEDNFHEARDRILIDGEEAEGDPSDDGEEEVFGLGLDDASDEPEEEEQGDVGSATGTDNNSVVRRRKKTRSSIPQSKSSSSGSESEESESWGRKRSGYYASNAYLLQDKEGEDDEEEANEMEEQEARRLQARMRENMVDEDYGLDDDIADVAAEEATLEDSENGSKSSRVVPIADPCVDKATALRQLERTSPETLALVREWDDVARDLIWAQERLDRLESTTPDAVASGLGHLHYQTLLTYVTTLAFYLHLRAATPAASVVSPTRPSARLKAVLARLLTLKQALVTMEEYDFDASEDDDWDSDASDLDEEALTKLGRLMEGERRVMNELWGKGKKRLEDGELEALLKDAEADNNERPKKRARRENDVEKRTGQCGTSKGVETPPQAVFDLTEPDFVPTARSATRATSDMGAYGEVTALSMADNADKIARKRTLRFHVSKIENSARKKEEGRQKLGGDDDIPYRERKKEQEARIRREVAKTRGVGGDDLNVDGDIDMGDGSDNLTSETPKNDQEDVSDEEGEDGYYELVKRTKKEQKETQKRQYEDIRAAERLALGGDEDASGPRSLTRAILKNKGLTPRRSKSVRNPRVKKRERYEKAKKKVRSQKAVFKGGLAGKSYGGEASGISKVVKSIKL